LHAAPVQHCCRHAAGGVLPTTQRWKQAMLFTHCASLRQLSVCEQQAPITH